MGSFALCMSNRWENGPSLEISLARPAAGFFPLDMGVDRSESSAGCLRS
jgi:hypothetical protein